jgi:hypothetical protein
LGRKVDAFCDEEEGEAVTKRKLRWRRSEGDPKLLNGQIALNGFGVRAQMTLSGKKLLEKHLLCIIGGDKFYYRH